MVVVRSCDRWKHSYFLGAADVGLLRAAPGRRIRSFPTHPETSIYTGRFKMLSPRLRLGLLLYPAAITLPACGDGNGNHNGQVASHDEVTAKGCATSAVGVVAEIALATCLANAPGNALVPSWPTSAGAQPVVLYVDRSRSMRGFLDNSYATEAQAYRWIVDNFLVRLQPKSAFGFGSQITPIGSSVKARILDKDFYSDNNTLLEQVFDLVARDTALAATHVIVGDGRRGSAAVGLRQFVRMRDEARGWIDRGGMFLVAASLVPFEPVRDDPAGCRAATLPSQDRIECPLYVFAYVAPGSETQLMAAASAAFQHVFAWPGFSVSPNDIGIRATGKGSPVSLHPSWARARDGTPIARSQAGTYTAAPLRARLVVSDSQRVAGRASWSMLKSQDLRIVLTARPLDASALHSPWSRTGGTGALVRADSSEPLILSLYSFGAGSAPHIYRVDAVPSGEPRWLSTFDASDAQDASKTYGLGRLFEEFRVQASNQARVIARVFVVAN